MNETLVLLAGILTIVILYLLYRLELKGKISASFRWIIILFLFLLPAIRILLLWNKDIQEPGNIVSDFILTILYPIQIPSFILTIFLDGQLYKYIYKREAFYSGDETQFWPWIFLASSIFTAIVINSLISLIKYKMMAKSNSN